MPTIKVPGKHTAVGHWGHPWRRTQLEQVAHRIKALLIDKLLTRGRVVRLWLPVSSDTEGVVRCTCFKNTTDSSDRSCRTCHGVQWAPGYQRFLSETLFWCSAEDTSFTLTNAEVMTTKKANVIVLSENQTSGTVRTQNKSYSANPEEADWEVKLEAYRRADGGTFTLEFSTNNGTSWNTVSLTEVPSSDTGVASGFTGAITASDLNLNGGNIQFRITMTRSSVDDLTPAFEIVRLRRARVEDENSFWYERRRDDWIGGTLLIARTWAQEQDTLDPGRGRFIEHLSDRTWTIPLDHFDLTLTPDTPDCRVQDYLGPHPFYELVDGVMATNRYVITKTDISDQLGTFTWQSFDDRRAQDGEAYFFIW